jgi:hypothetical protein
MFNIGEDFQEAVLSRDLREMGEESRSGQDREGGRRRWGGGERDMEESKDTKLQEVVFKGREVDPLGTMVVSLDDVTQKL